jgi:uncharacterized protein (DUF58 family)
MGLPLLLLAWRGKIYPQRRMLALIAFPAIVALFSVFLPPVAYLALALLVILLLIAVADILSIAPSNKLEISRTSGSIASLGKPHQVRIDLINRSDRVNQVNIRDDLPDEFEATPDEFASFTGKQSKTRFTYEINSRARGKFDLQTVHVRVSSQFKFWAAFYRLPCQSTISVYPDMKQIAEYDLLARTNRLSQTGVRRVRKIGQDNEFERLRDYTKDDNYKHIDWRTTARRRKLTVKDFQSSQSQRIIFMVDCARMMTGQSDNLSMLDHAFNAMLMLSYIALKQGDSVGLLNFSDQIHNFTPPRNGIGHINRLLHASFDQEARYVEARYDKAFLYTKQRCSKRSLVVLITNVIDEINAHQIMQYTSNLTGQHLPLCLLLKDHDLFDMVDDYDPDHAGKNSVYEAAAAMTIVNWRREVLTEMKHRGVLALEAFPENMTSQLINQYLEIKARHLL